MVNWCNWLASKAGYRHIDTAHIYGSEHAVGEAIRQSGIPREDFFVTTKLPWNHAGRIKESLEESLQNAGFDYYDLVCFFFSLPRPCITNYQTQQYLIHWPQVLAYEGQSLIISIFYWLLSNSHLVPTTNSDGTINITPKNEDGSIKLANNPPSLSEIWAEMEEVLASGKVKVHRLH